MAQVQDVSVFFAFIGGVISFLSPCVLPLVPGYFSMLSGVSVEQLRQGNQPKSGLFVSALSFVTGLSVVLILLFGASASAIGIFLKQNRTILDPLAGALILLFGLHLLGVLAKMNLRTGMILGCVLVALGIAALLHHGPLFLGMGAGHFFSLSFLGFFGPKLARWLNQDVHIRESGKNPGILRGFVMGFAFAFGWSPCLGPILAGVLALASQSGTLPRAMFLMAVYSAGLSIPFLLTALGFQQFVRFYQDFRKHLHAVEMFSGVLLLFIGGLIFFNRLTWLAGKFGFMNAISSWLEHAVTGIK
jgi:cytochrome c-type biogenesis protein